MKTSEVLAKVFMHLGTGENMMSHRRHICNAIDYLYFHAKVIGDIDRTRVKNLIRGHLGLYATLEWWLYKNHGIPIRNTMAYRKKIMVTRHAWLAHLIEHYQSKGD